MLYAQSISKLQVTDIRLAQCLRSRLEQRLQQRDVSNRDKIGVTLPSLSSIAIGAQCFYPQRYAQRQIIEVTSSKRSAHRQSCTSLLALIVTIISSLALSIIVKQAFYIQSLLSYLIFKYILVDYILELYLYIQNLYILKSSTILQ